MFIFCLLIKYFRRDFIKLIITSIMDNDEMKDDVEETEEETEDEEDEETE